MFKTYDSAADVYQIIGFETPLDALEPQGAPRRPKGTPKDSQREGAKGTPKSPQREPREPKVAPKEATGTPKTPMGSQRDKIYISNS